MDERRPDIWIVRHGETDWSRRGLHTGRTNVPLTAAGEREAIALRRRFGGRPFALVLSSPLSRARETCRLVGYGDVAQAEDDLREWDYGVYEGRTTAEIQLEAPGWTIWDGEVPGGETAVEVGYRADRVLSGGQQRLEAMSSSSHTDTSCGSSPLDGLGSGRPRADCSPWEPPRSGCSATREMSA